MKAYSPVVGAVKRSAARSRWTRATTIPVLRQADRIGTIVLVGRGRNAPPDLVPLLNRRVVHPALNGDLTVHLDYPVGVARRHGSGEFAVSTGLSLHPI